MKKLFILTLGLVMISYSAQAVKLINKSSQSENVIIKCSSVSHSSIGSHSSRDIGSGPCTVTLKSSGAKATASGSTNIVIDRNSSISAQ